MPVTLTDEQLAQLRTQLEAGQRAQAIAEGATQIWNDPELSDAAKALWKKKFPEGKIPEYDIEQKVMARLDKEKSDREAAEKAKRDKEADEEYSRKRKATQEKYKFTDDAMGRLEQLMTERNVGDYDVAASFFASQEPQPSDGEGYDGQYWHHERAPEYKEIAQDPEGYARRAILQAIRNDQRRTAQT